jgi:hypothetical protein
MILVPACECSHTRLMTIKNAAFLAFLGTLLLSILLLWRLVMDILNVSQNLIPAVTLLASILYAFAAVTAAIFFFVFQSKQ